MSSAHDLKRRGEPMRPRSRINSCTGKQAYGSWHRALADAKRMNRMYDESLAPYRCCWCNSVHLGHVDPAHKDRRPRDE